MMDIFLAGTAVKLHVPLYDADGNPITASAARFRVIKHDGVEVLPLEVVAGFAGGTSVTVDVPAAANEIAVVDPATITSATVDSVTVREGRTVEVFLTLENGNTILVARSYALEPSQTLIAGVNSFQGYASAELVALEMTGMEGWSGAHEKARITALIEARSKICQLRFNLLNSNVNFGQDNLNYVPEGTYPTPYAGAFMFNGNLALLTPAAFDRLPPRFRAALQRAQVAEANALLGGSPADEKRREGLVLDEIGEVKQMWRNSKPVELPVSKRALAYLSPFVSMSKRIGRG